MSYATLMVHLDLDQENEARLSVVGDLAERFTARVIGVAAQAEPVYYADDVDAAQFVAEDLREMEDNLAGRYSATSVSFPRCSWRALCVALIFQRSGAVRRKQSLRLVNCAGSAELLFGVETILEVWLYRLAMSCGLVVADLGKLGIFGGMA